MGVEKSERKGRIGTIFFLDWGELGSNWSCKARSRGLSILLKVSSYSLELNINSSYQTLGGGGMERREF